ncbi:3-deoxy-manno-octulosonate cytidylyltransferase [Prevotella intermedia ATCC 25611 = DSM 20706]|uniref:3-deoxy-manno-octulosonate cytidylyltransferase n=1 Tax=Prevotella intermedia TaxID=28131 RepID=UPI0004915E2A|nr:3-deoxy-manno-octulosonate cytidylyltransferase [Prevotella intermedia]APW33341.1 3-deoxy-manno-octulosonate cytidylyltransferase [Prevotella intermedia ATCC 25611 = DSM 20706]
MKVIGIIPARYASSRFPGKPLAKLGGKYVIQRVAEQVGAVLDDVYVATDDERIYNTVTSMGAKAVMTCSDHQSGTDRIAEALEKIGGNFDVVVNIQGDEPFIQKSQIETVVACFNDADTQIATLGKKFATIEEAKNPNSPKIILDNRSYAMYFTRALAPYIRGKEESQWIDVYPFLKHIGLYAYRTEVLREVTKLPQSPLEIAEGLEQLRWLQNGYKIKVGLTEVETVGIDTPEDLQRAELFLAQQSKND